MVAPRFMAYWYLTGRHDLMDLRITVIFEYDQANVICFRENLSSLLIWALPRMPLNANHRAGGGALYQERGVFGKNENGSWEAGPNSKCW